MPEWTFLLRYIFFPMSPMLVEVLKVALQQGGNIEMVGAAFFAEATLHTVVHLLHLLVKLVGEVDAIGGTTKK